LSLSTKYIVGPLGQFVPRILEEVMSQQRIVLVLYVKASIEQVWDALTNPEITEKYWGKTRIQSDWKVGSKILYVRDGKVSANELIHECFFLMP